jgi:hypothetical protein
MCARHASVSSNKCSIFTLVTVTQMQVVNPRRDPSWSFSFFVPGHSMPKGSLECKDLRVGGKRMHITVDREAVREWMKEVAVAALKVKHQRIARGDNSFPYDAPMTLWPLFVFRRPYTIPEGPPVQSSGRPTADGTPTAFGDTDKLVRVIGDALEPGVISLGKSGRTKAHKAAVIRNDCLITEMEKPRKAFEDEGVGLQWGAYLKLTRASEEPVNLRLYV